MKTFEEIIETGRVIVAERTTDGFSGLIQFPTWQGTIICSNGAGWDHVSVAPFRRSYIPTWDDMAWLKNLIFNEDEAAIQIHPPKADYVNNLENCLHLWRCNYREMVLPPACLVGIKPGQTLSNLKAEIEAAYKIAADWGKDHEDKKALE